MNFIVNDIRAYLQQFTKWDLGVTNGQQRPLCREDYDWTSIQLKVALDSTTDSQTDTYNGPKNFHSLIFGISAHVAWTDVSTESLSIAGVGNPLVEDRLKLIAQNTKVSLQNSDKEGGSKIIHNAPKRLSGFIPSIWLPIPILVPNADTLEITCERSDTADDMDASVDVGLDFWILQVRADI